MYNCTKNTAAIQRCTTRLLFRKHCVVVGLYVPGDEMSNEKQQCTPQILVLADDLYQFGEQHEAAMVGYVREGVDKHTDHHGDNVLHLTGHVLGNIGSPFTSLCIEMSHKNKDTSFSFSVSKLTSCRHTDTRGPRA